ncbi:membrane-spanning 4-domains subfamily A member 4D-like isoform 1-T1 [Leptodactylus fuscus]|uniref:membrane-spanning 4-domains subfamily A member 4D-like isoform X1 n=2 Tax=Leptodactylus fuscus TaxID=238119 RepID=UPI003F4E49C2
MESVPASTMSAANNENLPPFYDRMPTQDPSTAPNWNPTPVPSYIQNVSQPLPAYTTSPSPQEWNYPTVAPQWSVARVAAPNSDPSSPFYITFLKGRPKALGTVMIIFAILEIGLGFALVFTAFTITLPSGITFWGPIFYIIAGSLSIAACAKPNTCLVRGSLALNIISSIFTIVAIILNVVDLGIGNCNYGGSHNDKYCLYLLNGLYAVVSLLLIINVLIFCLSLSLSIFGCRSLSKVTSNGPQVFLIQNDVVVTMNPATAPATYLGVAQPNAPPPPYVFQEVKATPVS